MNPEGFPLLKLSVWRPAKQANRHLSPLKRCSVKGGMWEELIANLVGANQEGFLEGDRSSAERDDYRGIP